MPPGDVALLPFPFADKEAYKKRPALVIVTDPAGRNQFEMVVYVMITSSTSRVRNPTSDDVTVKEWQAAGLLKPSVVRTRRFFSAESTLATKTLGEVCAGTLGEVKERVRSLLS